MENRMPQPQAEHHKLSALAGRWEAEETLYPSPWMPEGGKATGHMNARMGLGGFFLISDYRQERDGKTTYEGLGVYGYDPQEKCWTMWWADSMGPAVGLAKGAWEGDTLSFRNQGPTGYGRYSYTFDGPERVTFRLESSPDGRNWTLFMESRFRKR